MRTVAAVSKLSRVALERRCEELESRLIHALRSAEAAAQREALAERSALDAWAWARSLRHTSFTSATSATSTAS